MCIYKILYYIQQPVKQSKIHTNFFLQRKVVLGAITPQNMIDRAYNNSEYNGIQTRSDGSQY